MDWIFPGLVVVLLPVSKPSDVVLQDVNNKEAPMQTSVSNSYQFNFDRIMPGEYLIWAYVDKDSNNSYTFGKVDPLEFAEEFSFYPDTLNLRARWPVGDIEIDLLNKIIKR